MKVCELFVREERERERETNLERKWFLKQCEREADEEEGEV